VVWLAPRCFQDPPVKSGIFKKRWRILVLLASSCLILGTGCSGEREKGINSGKDRPQPPANAKP
jgi:hypothetical protein